MSTNAIKFSIYISILLLILPDYISNEQIHNNVRRRFRRLWDSDDPPPEQFPTMPKVTIYRKVRESSNGTVRSSQQDVYFWPGLDEREKSIIRSSFEQIHRRTCIRFNELDYKPWYHAERWTEGKPYIVIRKSKKFSGYSDNSIEGVNRRSLIYLSEKALNSTDHKHNNGTRGLVLEQLLKFMGLREEFLRPDALSYIQPISGSQRPPTPSSPPEFSSEQLMWPFDPESVTMPSSARDWFRLTIYCKGRQNSDIGAAQRAGLLTRLDTSIFEGDYMTRLSFIMRGVLRQPYGKHSPIEPSSYQYYEPMGCGEVEFHVLSRPSGKCGSEDGTVCCSAETPKS